MPRHAFGYPSRCQEVSYRYESRTSLCLFGLDSKPFPRAAVIEAVLQNHCSHNRAYRARVFQHRNRCMIPHLFSLSRTSKGPVGHTSTCKDSEQTLLNYSTDAVDQLSRSAR